MSLHIELLSWIFVVKKLYKCSLLTFLLCILSVNNILYSVIYDKNEVQLTCFSLGPVCLFCGFFYVLFCFVIFCSLFLVVCISVSDCLERLVSEMTSNL